MLFIPESTLVTPSWLAANRMAQEALEACGRVFFRSASASSGRFTSVPPLQGSMTVTGFPYLRAASRQRRACTLGCSQSI